MKLQAEQAYLEGIKKMDEAWDERITQSEESVRAEEEKMVVRQQKELEEAMVEADSAFSCKLKSNSEILNLKKIERNLAKMKKYDKVG